MTQCTKMCRFNSYVDGCTKPNTIPCPYIDKNVIARTVYTLTFSKDPSVDEHTRCAIVRVKGDEYPSVLHLCGDDIEALQRYIDTLISTRTDVFED